MMLLLLAIFIPLPAIVSSNLIGCNQNNSVSDKIYSEQPIRSKENVNLGSSIIDVSVGDKVFESYNETEYMLSDNDLFRIVEKYRSSVRGRQVRQVNSLDSWSSISCCRRASRIQARYRVARGKLQIQIRRCGSDFCTGCKDTLQICTSFRQQCSSSSLYSGFLNQFCPKTCGKCSPPPVTSQPSQSTNQLVRVSVYFRLSHAANPPIKYKFSRGAENPGPIWKSTSILPTLPGRVTHFYLSSRPFQSNNFPIFFCRRGQGSNELWKVQRFDCSGSWTRAFFLFGSRTPSTGMRIFVSSSRSMPEVTRLHTGTVRCCGYSDNIWSFFTTDRGQHLPQTTQRPTSRSIPGTNRATTPTQRTTRATTSTNKPTLTQNPNQGSQNPVSPFERECLEYHNFLRAVHNSPPMEWDPQLAASSQAWASSLAQCAPDSARQTKPGCPTNSFPHSQTGTVYRASGVGENIAWDLSHGGGSAQQAILRWYFEIFDYNRNNPTTSLSDRPIGHYTQLIWRNSRKLGCGSASNQVQQSPGFRLTSTWIVAQYSPGGNIRLGTRDQTYRLYNEQVPPAIQGACRIRCLTGSACLGYHQSFSCVCNGEHPQCTGSRGGCVVTCASPRNGIPPGWVGECRGQSSCRCSSSLGATCN